MTTQIKNNYLYIVVAVLVFIVVDQLHALKQLSEMNSLNAQIVDDYWAEIQKDQHQIEFLQSKAEQDQANFERHEQQEARERKYVASVLNQTTDYVESLSRCSIFNLRMDFCGMTVEKIGSLMTRNRKMLGYH